MVTGRVGQSCAPAGFMNASAAKTIVEIAARHIANPPELLLKR
jgi:hypothetical protein